MRSTSCAALLAVVCACAHREQAPTGPPLRTPVRLNGACVWAAADAMQKYYRHDHEKMREEVADLTVTTWEHSNVCVVYLTLPPDPDRRDGSRNYIYDKADGTLIRTWIGGCPYSLCPGEIQCDDDGSRPVIL